MYMYLLTLSINITWVFLLTPIKHTAPMERLHQQFASEWQVFSLLDKLSATATGLDQLSTGHRCWPPPPPLVSSRYMTLCTSTYQHPLRRPSVWSFWTICVEQPPHRTPPVWSLSGTVPPSAENVFVLAGSAAPSDCLLLGAVYKSAYLLTYLLTYLPTQAEILSCGSKLID